ncbi:MAG: OmpA family protein [Mangrovibacterium sp.]
MKRILFFLLFLMPFLMNGQPGTSSKKALKYFNEARNYYQQQETNKALEKLAAAIREDPDFVDVYLLQADIYQEMDSLALQIGSLEKAMTVDETKFPKTGYVLANAYFRAGEYEKACQAFHAFLDRFGNSPLTTKAKAQLSKCSAALELFNNPRPFQAENLGEAVNTEFDEYWPSLTIDGQTLIFTRLVPVDGFRHELMPRFQEDFFESVRVGGEWQLAEPIVSLNTMNNEGAQSVSADGKLIFFTACNQADGFGSCDIYFTRNLGGNWSIPRNAGEPVNSGAWESQPSISANGEYLYFASSRRGGMGGMDLWRCQLKGFSENGQPRWGVAENLGDSVNTQGNELSPFIHPDGETLYFASDEWPGLGGTDIFYTRLTGGSVWQRPANLGYPINTAQNEQGMIVDASGRDAYYSSNRPESQGLDLYRFELYDEARPAPVTYVRGQVVDHRSQLPVCARVELIDLEQGQLVAETNSCMEKGEFLLCLTLGKEYAFQVSCPGYLFFSENFELKEVHYAYDPASLTIPLMLVEAGSAAVLRNVFFQTASYELLDHSKAELSRLIDFLEQNPAVAVEIGGHTDNVGGVAYNDELSEMRARSVWQYLVDAGIPETRLSYRGYGMSQPVETNDTEEGRSRNRRTEFKILKVGEE